jgi:hypothetical protein
MRLEPRDRFSTIFLAVVGLVFVGTGLTFFVAPELFVGLRENAGGASADAVNDVRAIYGGLELGVGIFLLLAARQPGLAGAGLLLVVVLGGAMAVSRFAGFTILSGTSAAHLAYGALDVVGVALGVHGLRRLGRSAR